jgi:hypothetical protein
MKLLAYPLLGTPFFAGAVRSQETQVLFQVEHLKVDVAT